MPGYKVIRTGESLSAMLKQIVESGVKSKLHRAAISEKENQEATSQSLSAMSGSGDGQGLPTGDGDDAEPSKTMAADTDDKKLKTGDVTVDSIIAKLNSIRSGKSFRDETVKRSMDEYVQSLKVAERTALLAFLKGIAQIVTGEVGGEQAVDPADPAPAVSMTKKDAGDDVGSTGQSSGGGQRKTIKPNVIMRQGGGDVTKKKPPIEDTSAPVPLPIKPKRK